LEQDTGDRLERRCARGPTTGELPALRHVHQDPTAIRPTLVRVNVPRTKLIAASLDPEVTGGLNPWIRFKLMARNSEDLIAWWYAGKNK